MLYTLSNDRMSFSLNENGNVCSIVNKKTGNEYCVSEGETFRLIYQIDDYYERPVNASMQDEPQITVNGNCMTVFYPYLKSDDRVWDVTLKYTYTLQDNQLLVSADIENNCEVMVAELQTTAFAGIQGLGGKAEDDWLLVPRKMGHKIKDPAHADFFKHSTQFKRKYERPDQIHSDLDVQYPGFGCMQWYSLYNDRESIYVGNHDKEHRIICHHIERRVCDNTLRLGVIQYPFLEKGEKYTIPTMVYALFDGDWHEGAKLYGKWMREDYGWTAPEKPQWAKEFQGWLRVIFRTQSGEYNYRFTDIPWMFDQVQEAGLNTLFILGWPRGGFGKLRPDYYADENSLDDLKKGIDYVHSKGGKVIMYVSYHAVDRKSEYFTKEGGEATLMKDIYGDYVRYSETYAVDATYRKLMNMPRSQYCTCSGSDMWQEKMKKSADYCLDLGADGVLYDLGGTKPLFCFAEGHDHKKANYSRSSKADRYKDLRKNLKRYGAERIMMQEHCIDIYAQYMDMVQPSAFNARDNSCPEMLKYIFPEIVMTNRNMAMDEEKMYDNINFSFIYNLAFDMSIFRCGGTLQDVPNYTVYMKEIIALRKSYSKYFTEGLFIDEDGFEKTKDTFRQKAYRAKDGSVGIAVWNWSDKMDTVTYTSVETGKAITVTLEKDKVCFVEFA